MQNEIARKKDFDHFCYLRVNIFSNSLIKSLVVELKKFIQNPKTIRFAKIVNG